MTARRAPRISDGFNVPENPETEDVRRATTDSTSKANFPRSSMAVHPFLTDFGPDSATRYFRACFENSRVASLPKAKGKEVLCGQRRAERRPGFQRRVRRACDPFSEGLLKDDIENVHRVNYSEWEKEGQLVDSISLPHVLESEGDIESDGAPSLEPDDDQTLCEVSHTDTMRTSPLGRRSGSSFANVGEHSTNLSKNLQPNFGKDHQTTLSPTRTSRRSLRLKNRGLEENIDPRAYISAGAISSAPMPIPMPAPQLHSRRPINEDPPELQAALHEQPFSPATLGPRISRFSPSKRRASALSRNYTKEELDGSSSRRRKPIVSNQNTNQNFEEHTNEIRRSWRLHDNTSHGTVQDYMVSQNPSISSRSRGSKFVRGKQAVQNYGSLNFVRGGEDDGLSGSNEENGSLQWDGLDRATQIRVTHALRGLSEDFRARFSNNTFSTVRSRLPRPSLQSSSRTRYRPAWTNDNLHALELENSDLEDSDFAIDGSYRQLVMRNGTRTAAILPTVQRNTRDDDEGGPSFDKVIRDASCRLSTNRLREAVTTVAPITAFDYAQLAPKRLAKDVFKRIKDKARTAQRRVPDPIELLSHWGERPSQTYIHYHDTADKSSRNEVGFKRPRRAPAFEPANVLTSAQLRRQQLFFDTMHFPSSPNDPPSCPSGESGRGWPAKLPIDIFIIISQYLAHADVLNLRAVNSEFCDALASIIFRNVVTKFSKFMFDVNLRPWNRIAPAGSIFEKWGDQIRKFGVSFEIDLDGLQQADPKIIHDKQSSWWGEYSWPLPIYPRFSSLQQLEKLADNLALLKSAFKQLVCTSELALSIDSGHGWLNGPDMSDMTVWKLRCSKGTRVFGRSFRGEDRWHQLARNELFKWAQANSLNAAIKWLAEEPREYVWYPESRFLRSIVIRDLEDYKVVSEQPDHDVSRHTGGFGSPTNPNVFHPPQAFVGLVPNWTWQAPAVGPTYPAPVQNQPAVGLMGEAGRRSAYAFHRGPRFKTKVRKGNVVLPQWPVIFNGYNVAAEIGGHCGFIQDKVAEPKSFPLMPGSLTEAQAQWLMETVWAQRAFLSAYTTAILANKVNFRRVHSLHIAKISSGLLPSLEQREFWQALQGLTTLTILVSPDWRTEHSPGDQSFQANMLTSPVEASIKFNHFLRRHVSPIEHLSSLRVGFVGGGEHATGMLARNQHVLPAPITSAPRTWVTDHGNVKPNPSTMLSFNHIKNLTIENAWLSPCMLEGFMNKSKDTSLRCLTLESVSLTSHHSSRTNSPMTTLEDGLQPEHAPAAWLQEMLPSRSCWPAVIDKLTPGATFLERKYAAGMIDRVERPPPDRAFRGNVEQLTFHSCGYVRVSGFTQSQFNQNGLVIPNTNPKDPGLSRREMFLKEDRGSGAVMMKDRDSQGVEWPLLGTLTQCIHPIEKRVLEQAWGMSFGWGDEMDRWDAVEDGFFEGGTGRFSGVVGKEK